MLTISVTKRSATGRKSTKQLRVDGKIPAILYGQKKDVIPLVVNPEVFLKLTQKHERLVKFELDGKEESAVIREVQYNSFGNQVLHIDFVRIDMTKKLKVSVNLEYVNTPKGVSLGGVWEKFLHNITISCLPAQIPDHIVVDVEGMNVGDMLRTKDIKLPEGFILESDPEVVATSVQTPRVEATPEVAPAASDRVEPEIIKKPKPVEGEDEKEKKEKK